MNRIAANRMRFQVFPVVMLCSVLLCGSCVDDDGASMFVSAQIAADNDCVFDVSNTRVLQGQFNAESRDEYTLFPLINNQLRNRASDAPIRTDPNGIRLMEAEVEIQRSNGDRLDFANLANPFTVPMGDFVASSVDSITPGQIVGRAQGIPPDYADQLLGNLGDDPEATALVVLKVRVMGKTNGDISVDSQEWLWPVVVCRGQCLFTMVGGEDTEVCCTPGQDIVCRL